MSREERRPVDSPSCRWCKQERELDGEFLLCPKCDRSPVKLPPYRRKDK